MKVPEDADRDFTAGAIVVENGEVLLVKHSKLGMWLQPGGHIEKDEVPHEAAERETVEETGIKIKFHDHFTPSRLYDGKAFDLPRPFHVNLHEVESGHWHCSFLFLAEVAGERKATHGHEHEGMEWFSRKEIENLEEIPENLRQAALKGLEITD